MNSIKRPALYVLIPLCLGILLSGTFNPPVIRTMAFSFVFILLAVIFFRRKALSVTALLLALTSAAMALYGNSNIIPRNDVSNFIAAHEKGPVLLKGVVADDPITTQTTYGKLRTTFTLRAERVRKTGTHFSWENASGLVRTDIFSKSLPPISFGDRVVLEGSLSGPRALNNPGLFNYARYLWSKNIYSCLSVKEGGAVKNGDSPHIAKTAVRGHSPFSGSLKLISYKIRHRLRAVIDEYLDMPYSGFLKAVLIGDTSALRDKVRDDFVKTGTVHVIAVSGLQVGIIATLVLAVFGLLGVPKKVNLAVTTVTLLFYAFIAGANPPIIRAVIMFAIYSIGYLIDRDSDTLNSLSIAAIAILLWNPKELYDPSFQLSFASLFGIIILMPGVRAFISGGPGDVNFEKLRRIRRYMIYGVSMSLAAWLGTSPIVVAYFNIISPVSIIANLIVIPMLFILMAASFLFVASSLALPCAAVGLAQILQLMQKALFLVNGLLAGLPFAYFRLAKPSGVFTILYYLLIFIIFVPESLKIRSIGINRPRAVIVILLILNLLIWPGVLFGSGKDFKVTFIDVGQGDSAFLEFPGGSNMLVDGGTGGVEEKGDMGESVVAPFLWNKGIGVIDALVVTHFHDDHLGGILYMLKNFKVGCVIDSGASPEARGVIYEDYLRTIKAKKIRRLVVRQGDVVSGLGGAGIFILNPGGDRDLSDSNDNSIVVKVSCKDLNILLCGDIKDGAMSRLAEYGDFLKCDIIKVPHHGGYLGNAEVVERFFRSASPEISVISVGAQNMYGMPSYKTTAIIDVIQSVIYCTKDAGAVEISVGEVSRKVRTASGLKV